MVGSEFSGMEMDNKIESRRYSDHMLSMHEDWSLKNIANSGDQ